MVISLLGVFAATAAPASASGNGFPKFVVGGFPSVSGNGFSLVFANGADRNCTLVIEMFKSGQLLDECG